ncbi:MAG: hypothetical protein ACI4SA_04240 [Lachnospiraceae bacterium]
MKKNLLLFICIILAGSMFISLIVNADTVGSADIIHSHAGDATTGGGCYSVENVCGGEIKAHTDTTQCGGTCTKTSWCTAVCSKCGKTFTNTVCTHGQVVYDCTICNGNTANAGYNRWPINQCDANKKTVTVYKCSVCGTEASGTGTCTKTTYTLGCGLNDGDKAGTVTIERQVSEQNYKLTPAVGSTAGCISNVSCSPSSHQVTSNGSYAFTVNYTDSGVSKSVSVSCTISDYDGTAPVINSITASTTAETTGSVSLSVNATDNVGVTAYRMDGGSWQSGSTFSVNKNGTYTFNAKDAFGNVSEGYTYVVDNIIKKTPSNPQPVDPTKPVEPTEPVDPTEPVEPTKPVEPTEPVEPKEPKKPSKTDDEISEETEPDETEEPETVAEVKKPTIKPIQIENKKEPVQESQVEVEEPENENNFVSGIATAGVVGTTESGIIVFIVFWIFRKCTVYDEATDKKIGRAYIWKKKKEYRVKISNRIAGKAEKNIYIVFPKRFVKANEGKPVKISVYDEEYEKSIQEKIYISI